MADIILTYKVPESSIINYLIYKKFLGVEEGILEDIVIF